MGTPELTALQAAELRGARFLRGLGAPKEVYQRLDDHHGVEPAIARHRLHRLKAAGGLGPADNLVFGRTGDVYDERTGEFLGSLTDPNS